MTTEAILEKQFQLFVPFIQQHSLNDLETTKSYKIIVNNNLFKKNKNQPLKLPAETFYLNE